MPRNLVLVRHGQSEANIMVAASKKGDDSYYSEDTKMIPDRSWRLSSIGVKQAQVAGEWMKNNINTFDRHIVSPFVRTCETAGNLQLDNATWEENRVIRERNWGEIDGIARSEFHEKYPLNAIFKKKDPLYWSPPSGESIANVAENRVRNILNTLHRESSEDDVVMVTHGEFIWATRLVLERWSDDEFNKFDKDPNYKVHNCTVVHYSRENPWNGKLSDKIRWVRTAYPILNKETETWEMFINDWYEFDRPYLTNEQLLEKAASRAHYFDSVE